MIRLENISKVYSYLTKEKTFSNKELERIVAKESRSQISQLKDTINALILSNAVFIKKKNFIEFCLGKLTGKIKINSSNGNIKQLLIIPSVPKIENLSDLIKYLGELNGELGVILKKDNKVYGTNIHKNFAIASLIKIKILNEVLKCLNLKSLYQVKPDDISVLSLGLSNKDVGKFITVEKLVDMMINLSDNTAMDILLSMLKKLGKCEEIQFTKDIYGTAWCSDKNNSWKWREESLNKVMWDQGYDYCDSLDSILETAEDLQLSKFNPWKTDFIYKGGNAPGVISILLGSQDKGTYFAAVINKKSSFTIIEELYFYECIRYYTERIRLVNE